MGLSVNLNLYSSSSDFKTKQTNQLIEIYYVVIDFKTWLKAYN